MVEMQLTGQLNGSGLVEKAPGQSSKVNGDLVDWPKSNLDDYVFTPVNTVINAWQYLAFTCLGQIAGVLGKEDDRTRFSTLASRLAAAMNTTLLREDGSYRDGVATEHCAQHATAFPLAFGVTPPAFQSRAGRNLAAQGMRSSVYGAQFLLDALFSSGQEQAALRLLESRDMFSWLHMIDDLHATIAMEAWDPSIKPNTTFCHAWGTAPANVIPRHLVGVEVIRPGASEISIAPKPGNLDWFRAVVPTIRGGVRVEYHRAGPNVLDVDVPPNVVARLDLSGLERAIGKALAVETRGYTAATSNTGSGSIAYLLRPGRATIVRA
jgi:alpha-L-rhamnosidase